MDCQPYRTIKICAKFLGKEIIWGQRGVVRKLSSGRWVGGRKTLCYWSRSWSWCNQARNSHSLKRRSRKRGEDDQFATGSLNFVSKSWYKPKNQTKIHPKTYLIWQADTFMCNLERRLPQQITGQLFQGFRWIVRGIEEVIIYISETYANYLMQIIADNYYDKYF